MLSIDLGHFRINVLSVQCAFSEAHIYVYVLFISCVVLIPNPERLLLGCEESNRFSNKKLYKKQKKVIIVP